MEYAGFHLQNQFQNEPDDQCMISATPHDHKQSWIPSNIYNGYDNGFMTNSREIGNNYAMNMIDSLRVSTRQALAFGSHHDEQNLSQKPTSDILPPKLSEIMNIDEYSREPQFSPRDITGTEYLPVENLLIHAHKPIYQGGMTLNMRDYNFDDVSSISNLPTPNTTSSLVSCSLGLNSQMLDPQSSYSTESCGLQLCYETFGLNEEHISLSHGNRKISPSNTSNNISPFVGEVTMRKRPSNWSRPKECEAKAKKLRPSCPPLKVRKEKLGDRIQTLQKLVAPFGKTSTVCVLSEAIGYIHFLHEQMQTLSNIPYMKSVQSKPPRMVQLDSRKLDSREFKPDLRSRGFCLVPVSYASFINHCA